MTDITTIQVREIMTREVIRARPDITLENAQHLFTKHHFHHLLIFNQRKLVGIISDRDILKNTSPFINKLAERAQDINTLNKPLHQFMSRNIVTIPEAACIKHAARIMTSRRVSCLPVTDDHHNIVGIITHRDILHLFYRAA